jgi:hypothetical protein
VAFFAGKKRQRSDESVFDVVLPDSLDAGDIHRKPFDLFDGDWCMGVVDLSGHVTKHLQKATGKSCVHGLLAADRKLFSPAEEQMA